MIFRKAHMGDLQKITSMINNYADMGLMLPRTVLYLCQRIREYTVIEENGEIIGVGGLHILWHDLAEICSLAIHPQKTKIGLGMGLAEHLIMECRKLQIEKIFALTYQPAFFEKCGFKRIDKDQLPQKVWTECINCPKFPNCDEIALIRTAG
ncbi:MAG TPA: N-acetyltransferase [Firmicutes bacterium]|nr:N-acetyltransferase [Bacillota bacterium]